MASYFRDTTLAALCVLTLVGIVAPATSSARRAGAPRPDIRAARAARASCVPAVLNRTAVLSGTSLTVSPLPDSLDASPNTQISLLGTPAAVQRFRSRPDLRPPAIAVNVNSPAAAPGDLFAVTYSGKEQGGPLIYDARGQAVWFHPLPYGESATNLQVQQYGGQPVLTWWQGSVLPQGFGDGR
jgi:hypothetical protein